MTALEPQRELKHRLALLEAQFFALQRPPHLGSTSAQELAALQRKIDTLREQMQTAGDTQEARTA